MPPIEKNNNSVGAVIIGRNEGDRLRVCLESVVENNVYVVYVDSGSTDNSIETAKSLGVDIIYMDTSIPFTAARARNAGYNHLKTSYSDISYVQFVDGDCEVVKGWIDKGISFLSENLDVALVCGRLRERYPEASVYNNLCDMEWNTSIGESKACGGIFLIRSRNFKEVSGFNSSIIAGEEPELCLRIRDKGWKIIRLDVEMALHDANIMRFGQWWKRNVRAGYAYALGAAMHGAAPEYHRVHETKRIWLWGLYIPSLILVTGLINPWLFTLLAIYPMQIVRIKFKNPLSGKNAWLYALFVTVGKFPEMQGQLKFLLDRLMNKKSAIIEYKG